MIKRWDELALGHLEDKDFWDYFLKKEKKFAFVPQNNSFQHFGNYLEFKVKEQQKIINFVKEYFSQMTIAEVVTSSDINPELTKKQSNKKLVEEVDYSTKAEFFNKDVIKYATTCFSNHLLSKISPEMIMDYKSINFAMELLVSSNEDISALEFDMVKSLLDHEKYSSKLRSLGERGRAELWRNLRPSIEIYNEEKKQKEFNYVKKVGAIEITETSALKYRLHDFCQNPFKKCLSSVFFNAPLHKDLYNELSNQGWQEVIDIVADTTYFNSKSKLAGILIDYHFPQQKIVEKRLLEEISKEKMSSNSFSLYSYIERVLFEIEAYFPKSLIEKKQRDSLLNVFNETLGNVLVSEKTECINLNYFYAKIAQSENEDMNQLRFFNMAKNANPDLEKCYEIISRKEKNKEGIEQDVDYLVIDIKDIFIKNISLSNLRKNKNKNYLLESMVFTVNFLKEIGSPEINLQNKGLYVVATPLGKEGGNGVFERFDYNKIEAMILATKKIVEKILNIEEHSMEDVVSVYDKRIMEGDLNRNNASIPKFKGRKF